MKAICHFEPDSLTLCQWGCSKAGAAGPGSSPSSSPSCRPPAIQHNPTQPARLSTALQSFDSYLSWKKSCILRKGSIPCRDWHGATDLQHEQSPARPHRCCSQHQAQAAGCEGPQPPGSPSPETAGRAAGPPCGTLGLCISRTSVGIPTLNGAESSTKVFSGDEQFVQSPSVSRNRWPQLSPMRCDAAEPTQPGTQAGSPHGVRPVSPASAASSGGGCLRRQR